MKVYCEKNFSDFYREFESDIWAGRTSYSIPYFSCSELDNLDYLFEDMYPEGVEETTIWDILRFDTDFLFESLGYSDESEEGEEKKERRYISYDDEKKKAVIY